MISFTEFLTSIVLIIFTTNVSSAQREFIMPPLFSDDLSSFEATGRYATCAAVSDGYIIQTIVPQSGEPTGEYYENTTLLIKLDEDGNFIKQYKVSDHFDSIMTAMPSTVINDTLMFSAFDGKDWGQNIFGHPCFFRFDKDLNLIDFTNSRDTMFGLPQPSWSGLGSAVANNNTAYRFIFGGYLDNDQHGGSRAYGHTLGLDGKLRSVPIDANVPFFSGQAQFENDRILIVGPQAFTVFDTTWNTVFDGRRFADGESYPAFDSGAAGTIRGIIVNGAFYFFLPAGCSDVRLACVSAQKWSKNGDFLRQEILWRADPGRANEDGGSYGPAVNSKSYVYDNKKTIYSVHSYASIDSVHWDISAVDTNLILKWRKTITQSSAFTYANDISFSVDSSKLLILGLDGPAGIGTVNPIISYFIDTLGGEVSSVRPISPSVKDEVFLVPTVTSNSFGIVGSVQAKREIVVVRLYELGSGNMRLTKALDNQLDVSELPVGAYVAIGYNKDQEPISSQRVVITR